MENNAEIDTSRRGDCDILCFKISKVLTTLLVYLCLVCEINLDMLSMENE